MATGKVVGGHYLNSFVSPMGSTLVVQAPLKFRKLISANVAAWAEVPTDSRGNPFSAVGQAVAAAAIPGRFGKAASAAVGASFDAMGPSHVVRVDWADGKQSLIKMPDPLYKHFEVMLKDRHVPDPEPTTVDVASAMPEKPTITEQAFGLVSGIVKERFPTRGTAQDTAAVAPAAQPDITEQLTKLASLRDAGILTDEEFAAKKAEILARF